MKRAQHYVLLIMLPGMALGALLACAAHQNFGNKHPMEVKARQLCSECHSDWRTSLDHRGDFIALHKFAAAQRKQVCGLCHAESFCADCHGASEEIKASDKFRDRPERTLPHRGNYLIQHRIDGKINPSSCFPCHGRQNNERCKVCHR